MLRDQLYWQFREALDPESGDDVKLPPNARLMAQLTAHRYEIRGTDIKVESKEEINKRTGASPDESDATVQAWYRRKSAVKSARKAVALPLRKSGWMG